MTGFLETHRYRKLTLLDGRALYVSAAYVRMIEEVPGGGAAITVADQASTRQVRESVADIIEWLEQGTVRYAEGA